jgi:zinc transport system substrate-binding protein
MYRKIFFQSFLLSLMVLHIGCKTGSVKEQSVTVSILPQQYWIDVLTDSTLAVNCIVPSGNNPETYSPTPRQMQTISNSLYYFYIGGLGFENTWVKKFPELNPNVKMVNTTEFIQRIKGEHHHIHSHSHGESCSEEDPHLWTSPKRAIQMVSVIYSVIKESALTDTTILNRNFATLITRLKDLDNQFVLLGENNKGKAFIIYHPALGYLAHDYGFTQLSIEREGKEPTIANLKSLVQQANAEKITTIFIQKQFDKENARIIANETNARIVEINPLGYDYIAEMQLIHDKLKEMWNE